MKIIIFTASTGGGHKRAAAAIEAKIKAVSPDTKDVYKRQAIRRHNATESAFFIICHFLLWNRYKAFAPV